MLLRASSSSPWSFVAAKPCMIDLTPAAARAGHHQYTGAGNERRRRTLMHRCIRSGMAWL
jgi:hypothetical protein